MYVFVKDGDGYTQQAKLVSPSRVLNKFGYAVDVSGDRVVVGEPYADVSGVDKAGKAYVFKRTGTSWDSGTLISPLSPLRPMIYLVVRSQSVVSTVAVGAEGTSTAAVVTHTFFNIITHATLVWVALINGKKGHNPNEYWDLSGHRWFDHCLWSLIWGKSLYVQLYGFRVFCGQRHWRMKSQALPVTMRPDISAGLCLYRVICWQWVHHGTVTVTKENGWCRLHFCEGFIGVME